MDSARGQCWVCESPAGKKCPKCNLSSYCSRECQKKDRVRHFEECIGSTRRRQICSNCGNQTSANTFPCSICCAVHYCSDTCERNHANVHDEVCEHVTERILGIAHTIQGWNRRGKNSPHYFGRLVHASDFVKWSDNENGSDLVSSMESLSVLMFGADLKHLFLTLSRLPADFNRVLDTTLLDASPHLLSRNVLLLFLIRKSFEEDPQTTKESISKVVLIYYSLKLDASSFSFLCRTLETLQNMNFTRFMLETRNTIKFTRGTFNKIQRIWRGWLTFSSNPEALRKMRWVRTCKISSAEVQQMMDKVRNLLPKGQEAGFLYWLNHGSFIFDETDGVYPNVTLSSFNPSLEEYLVLYPDIQLDSTLESGAVGVALREDLMIYSPYGTDMLFQDWDYHDVIQNISPDEDPEDLLTLYQIFMENVLHRTGELLISGDVKARFILTEMLDDKVETILPVGGEGVYDRICTGLYADIIGLPKLLKTLSPHLNKQNPFARLITHHRLWSTFIEEKNITMLKKEWVSNNNLDKPVNPSTAIATKWATFRQFLQAELLCYRSNVDCIQFESEEVPSFDEIVETNGFLMIDFLADLNTIFPFRFRNDKRYVTMVDNKLYTLEWKNEDRRGPRESKLITPREISERIAVLTDVQLSESDTPPQNPSEDVSNVFVSGNTSPIGKLSPDKNEELSIEKECSSADVSKKRLFWESSFKNERGRRYINPYASYFEQEAELEYSKFLSRRARSESRSPSGDTRSSEKRRNREVRPLSRSLDRESICARSNTRKSNDLQKESRNTISGNISTGDDDESAESRYNSTVKELISLFSKENKTTHSIEGVAISNTPVSITKNQIKKSDRTKRESCRPIHKDRSAFRMNHQNGNVRDHHVHESNSKLQSKFKHSTKEESSSEKVRNQGNKEQQKTKHHHSSVPLICKENVWEKKPVVPEISKCHLRKSMVNPCLENENEDTSSPSRLKDSSPADERTTKPIKSVTSVKNIISAFESSTKDLRGQTAPHKHVRLSRSKPKYRSQTSPRVKKESILESKGSSVSYEIRPTKQPKVNDRRDDFVNQYDTRNDKEINVKRILDTYYQGKQAERYDERRYPIDANETATKFTDTKITVAPNIRNQKDTSTFGDVDQLEHDSGRCINEDKHTISDEGNKKSSIVKEVLITKPSPEILKGESLHKNQLVDIKEDKTRKAEETITFKSTNELPSKPEGELDTIDVFKERRQKFEQNVNKKQSLNSFQKNEHKPTILNKFPFNKKVNHNEVAQKKVPDIASIYEKRISDIETITKSQDIINSEHKTEKVSRDFDAASPKSISRSVSKEGDTDYEAPSTDKVETNKEDEIREDFEISTIEDIATYQDGESKEGYRMTFSEHVKVSVIKTNEDIKSQCREHITSYTIKEEEVHKDDQQESTECLSQSKVLENTNDIAKDLNNKIASIPIETDKKFGTSSTNDILSPETKETNNKTEIALTENKDKEIKSTENENKIISIENENNQDKENIFDAPTENQTSEPSPQGPITETKAFISKILWKPLFQKKTTEINDKTDSPKKKLSFKHLLMDIRGNETRCSTDKNTATSDSPKKISNAIEIIPEEKEKLTKKEKGDEDQERDDSPIETGSLDDDTENDSGIEFSEMGVEEAIDATSLLGLEIPEIKNGSALREREIERENLIKRSLVSKRRNTLFITEDEDSNFVEPESSRISQIQSTKVSGTGDSYLHSENRMDGLSSYFKSLIKARSLRSPPVHKNENQCIGDYQLKEIKRNLVPFTADQELKKPIITTKERPPSSPIAISCSDTSGKRQAQEQEECRPRSEGSSSSKAFQGVLKREGQRNSSKKLLRVSWGDLPQYVGSYPPEEEEEIQIIKKETEEGELAQESNDDQEWTTNMEEEVNQLNETSTYRMTSL